MVVTASPQPAVNRYPGLFQDYVQRGIAYLLAEVLQWEGRLASDLREQALHLLPFGLSLAPAWQSASRLLLTLAPHMEQEGAWRLWLPYLEAGCAQSRLQQDRAAEAALALHLGLTHRSLANYAEARQWLRQSAIAFGDLGDHPNQAKAWNALGFLERLAGRPQEGASYSQRALALLGESDLECATSYGVLGAVAFDQRSWTQATAYFQQALAICQQHNHQRKLAWALEDLAAARWAQQHYAEAIDDYERALAILQALHAPVQQAVVQMNLAALYLSLQQAETALPLMAQAERIFQQTHDQRGLAIIHSNQGIAYRYLRRWELARPLLQSSIKLAQQIEYHTLAINTADELGVLYLECNALSAAVQTFQEALTWLPRVADQATRNHYEQEITTHLQEALTKIGVA